MFTTEQYQIEKETSHHLYLYKCLNSYTEEKLDSVNQQIKEIEKSIKDVYQHRDDRAYLLEF